MDAALAFLEGLEPALVYVILGFGAALENIIPPVPADTFVLAGGFIAARGLALPLGVFLATWLANAGSALLVYGWGRAKGRRFFTQGKGRRVLSPDQLAALERFYGRWGIAALLVTRFFPGLRAVVPVFAGVTGEPIWRVAPPLILASAVWYGGLVWLGLSARGQLDEAERLLGQANRGFLVVAAVAMLAILVWWRRTRSRSAEEEV